MTTNFWSRWLLIAAAAVATYAVGLVLAGRVAGRGFDLLGFGPTDGAVPDGAPHDYVVFLYAVLGSVIVGWMVLVAGIAAGPLRSGEAWAVPVLAASIVTWFVLDTGASLALGFWAHAVFNVAFLGVIGLPLVRLRRSSRPAPHPR